MMILSAGLKVAVQLIKAFYLKINIILTLIFNFLPERLISDQKHSLVPVSDGAVRACSAFISSVFQYVRRDLADVQAEQYH